MAIMSDNLSPEPAPPAEAGNPAAITPVNGGVNLDAQHDVHIEGDVVGRDKIVNVYNPQQTGLTDAVSRILEYLGKSSEVDANRRFFEDHVEPANAYATF